MFSKNSHDTGSAGKNNSHDEGGEMLSHEPGEFKVHNPGQSFYIHDTGSVD